MWLKIRSEVIVGGSFWPRISRPFCRKDYQIFQDVLEIFVAKFLEVSKDSAESWCHLAKRIAGRILLGQILLGDLLNLKSIKSIVKKTKFFKDSVVQRGFHAVKINTTRQVSYQNDDKANFHRLLAAGSEITGSSTKNILELLLMITLS